jgi:hypothetical protein
VLEKRVKRKIISMGAGLALLAAPASHTQMRKNGAVGEKKREEGMPISNLPI